MAVVWVVTLGMQHLRDGFNRRFVRRDKTSDGSIGDLAHQNEAASGHNPDITGAAEYKDGDSLNEVRAIDVDNNLNDPEVTFEQVIQHMVMLGRNGDLEKVIRYMIYNRRIWRASNNWATETYTGASQHTEHGHFSGAYTQASDNNTTYDYGFDELGDDMPYSQEDLERFPWLFTGNPLPAGKSAVFVLADINTSTLATLKALTALVTDETTRAAADAARDAGVLAAVQAIGTAGTSTLTQGQMDQILAAIQAAAAEASQAAAKQANAKLEHVVSALVAAGEGLTTADDV